MDSAAALGACTRSSTAVVVVDLQNAFCHLSGSLGRLGLDTTALARVVSPCHRIIEAARVAGVRVIFTALGFLPDYSDAGRSVREIQTSLCDVGGLVRGTWDAAIVEGLTQPGDVIVEKHRADSFLGGALEHQLIEGDIESVILCGVTTSVCVVGTARAAAERDFRTIVAEDAVADLSEVAHQSSLDVFASTFGYLASTAEIQAHFGAISRGHPREDGT